MGEMFYRGINPSTMSFTELRYYGRWHKVIVDAEMKGSK